MGTSSLALWLLGPPRLEVGGAAVEISRHKATALLVYLAVTGEAQHRDKLATMFWPDSPQSRARASLRRDLSILNKTLGADWVTSNQDTLRLRRDGLWLDVMAFRSRLESCDHHGHDEGAVCAACLPALAEAVDLYEDDFLAGFSLPDCPEFDEWQFFQAESLRQALLSALERLVQGYRTQGAYESAIPYARRWVALDPLHEAAHRQLIWLYGRSQQKAAALRHYRICAQTLQEELDLEPSPETIALYEQIRTMQGGKGAATEDRLPQERGEALFSRRDSTPPHKLPVSATPFVGRVEGLADITQRLKDPACRLLTLVGPGGIGKTRLAIQAAQNLVDHALGHPIFADGVYLVRLANASAAEHMLSAIAGVLDFSFYRQVAPREQLLNFLREKTMLLLLDSFEHLLAPTEDAPQKPTSDGTDLAADILQTAPGVKLLITSREALNLQEEWIYPVKGMRYPTVNSFEDKTAATDLESYSALQLFAQSARRVQPDFDFAAEADCVVHICRLVEGLPLAIELAAAWSKVLPCAEIAHEIERDLDLLATTLRNVPDRHRSIRVVFDQSWQRLAPDERDTLLQLSVFRGGFKLEAAQDVGGATLSGLAALVEKSLLRVSSSRRYSLHELLRQFIREKLTETSQAAIQNRHADYYVAFLSEREQALHDEQQREALAEIRGEIGNVRAAWEHAINQRNIALVERSLDTFYQFLRISSRFQEGLDTFQRAAEQWEAKDLSPEILLRLKARQGKFCAALGIYGLARELLQQSLSLARQLNDREEIAFSLDVLGNVVHVQGDNLEAIPLYEEGLTISRAIGDQSGTASALYNLGWIAIGQGEYGEAKHYFQESLGLYRAIGNESGIAHGLDSLGMTAFFLGEDTAAAQFFEEGLTIFEALGDRYGAARALSGLGLVAWGMGERHLGESGKEFEHKIDVSRLLSLSKRHNDDHMLSQNPSAVYLTRARQLLTQSVEINRAIGHRLEVARRLGFLGSVTNSQADYESAGRFLREALTISRELGHQFGISWSLAGLGTTALGQSDKQGAKAYFYEALEFAVDAHELPVILDLFVSLAGLMIAEDQDLETAVMLLTLVINHPAAWQVMKQKADRLLAELKESLPAQIFAAGAAQGQGKTLETAVLELMTG